MNKNLNTFIYGLILMIVPTLMYGQPTIMPLKSNPILSQSYEARRQNVSVRSQAVELPFYDDFSYAGPYTNQDLWIGDDAFVNTAFPIAPPSVGVATLDGLDGQGNPYNGGPGGADTLTSQGINLAGLTAADNVNLSFYIEPGGLGYAPAADDILTLEFKKSNGSWVNVGTYVAGATDVFLFKYLMITDPAYLHGDFQFRFVNFCSRQGMGEIWHIDYVRLQKDIIATETYNDIAFTSIPTSILSGYTAIPKTQFVGHENELLTENIGINIFNHFENTNDVQNTNFQVKELNSNTLLHDVGLLNGNQADIPAGSATSFMNSIIGFNDLANQIASVSNGSDSLLLETKYSYNVGEEDASIAGIVDNNTVKSTINIDGHFAYDDGTAEAGIFCGNSGNQIAVKFTATTAGTLHAIGMHIPHITNDVAGQQIKLKVWIGNLDDTPEYDGIIVHPVYVSYNQLEGFNRYLLMDEFGDALMPLDIPAGDFYIGWQQVVGSSLDNMPVGLDYNTDASDNCYFSSSSTAEWVNFGSSFDGSLMLRPYFELPQIVANQHISSLSNNIKIYPNPSSGTLQIEGIAARDILGVHILSMLGQEIALEGKNTLNLPTQLANGTYILKLQTEQGIITQKFVLVR